MQSDIEAAVSNIPPSGDDKAFVFISLAAEFFF